MKPKVLPCVEQNIVHQELHARRVWLCEWSETTHGGTFPHACEQLNKATV